MVIERLGKGDDKLKTGYKYNPIKYKESGKSLIISGIYRQLKTLMKEHASTARPRVHNHVISLCKNSSEQTQKIWTLDP